MAVTPLYYLQLCREDGTPIRSPFRPVRHRHGTVSIPLIDTCVQHILAQGVGFWRTEAQVKAAIIAGMQAAIQELKEDARDVVGGA